MNQLTSFALSSQSKYWAVIWVVLLDKNQGFPCGTLQKSRCFLSVLQLVVNLEYFQWNSISEENANSWKLNFFVGTSMPVSTGNFLKCRVEFLVKTRESHLPSSKEQMTHWCIFLSVYFVGTLTFKKIVNYSIGQSMGVFDSTVQQLLNSPGMWEMKI